MAARRVVLRGTWLALPVAFSTALVLGSPVLQFYSVAS